MRDWPPLPAYSSLFPCASRQRVRLIAAGADHFHDVYHDKARCEVIFVTDDEPQMPSEHVPQYARISGAITQPRMQSVMTLFSLRCWLGDSSCRRRGWRDERETFIFSAPFDDDAIILPIMRANYYASALGFPQPSLLRHFSPRHRLALLSSFTEMLYDACSSKRFSIDFLSSMRAVSTLQVRRR